MNSVQARSRVVEQLSTPGEAGLVLRITEETVRAKLRSGEIRGVKLGKGPAARWRIPASELERLSGRTA